MHEDERERILQGLLAAGGFVNSAINRLADNNEKGAMKYMGNALIILNRLIKSLRGF